MEPNAESCKHEKLDKETGVCLICGYDPVEEYDLDGFDDETGDVGVFH
jgi:hypothetical protein